MIFKRSLGRLSLFLAFRWLALLLSFAMRLHKAYGQEYEIDLVNSLNEYGSVFASTESYVVFFLTENNTVVKGQTGSTAFLPCTVTHVGEGTVSWIRKKDNHLLTVGLSTYTNDDRFQAIHLQHSLDWTLQVKYVQLRDAGLYECQVPTHPPSSIFVYLEAVEATAEIDGSLEKYLKPGSRMEIECKVTHSTETPTYLFWYHNNRMINFDFDRGINVSTVLEEKVSVLTINNAATRHTGNYSCVPSNAKPASTYVHILNGENPAAMQQGGKGFSWLQACPSTWIVLLSFFNIVCWPHIVF